MSTTLYFRNASTYDFGDFWTGTPGWSMIDGSSDTSSNPYYLATSNGSADRSLVAYTTTGPTAGREFSAGGLSNYGSYVFVSPPVDEDVTISGSITFNLVSYESSMSANAAVNCAIYKLAASTLTITQVHKTVRSTELGTGAAAANWSETPTSFSLNKGDRILLVPFIDDGGGTMATGYQCYLHLNNSTGRDSYVTFNETFSVGTEPAGTTLYFTDVASDVNTAAVDRQVRLSRDDGSVNDTVYSVSGPTSPVQITDAVGGTVVDWWSPPFVAFTLGGSVRFNGWFTFSHNNASVGADPYAEIAVCDADGTNAVVWAKGVGKVMGVPNWPITSTVNSFLIAGDDVSVSDGQRLRVRIGFDDSAKGNMYQSGTSYYSTFSYGRASAGATGDSYLTFSQNLVLLRTFTLDAEIQSDNPFFTLAAEIVPRRATLDAVIAKHWGGIGIIDTWVLDSFTRTHASSWGSADTGGAYTNDTHASVTYSTDGSSGKHYSSITTPGSGVGTWTRVGGTGKGDREVIFRAKSTYLGNSYQNVDVNLRRITGSSESTLTGYRAVFTFARPSGAVNQCGISVLSAGTGSTYNANTTDPGVADEWVWCKCQIRGTYPTVIRIKMWVDGDPEPADWLRTVEDSVSTRQGADVSNTWEVRLVNYCPASGNPNTLWVDNISVKTADDPWLTWTFDAEKRLGGQFTLDANIVSDGSFFFADAVILGSSGTKTFALDANLARTWSFSLNAVIRTHRTFGTDVRTLSLINSNGNPSEYIGNTNYASLLAGTYSDNSTGYAGAGQETFDYGTRWYRSYETGLFFPHFLMYEGESITSSVLNITGWDYAGSDMSDTDFLIEVYHYDWDPNTIWSSGWSGSFRNQSWLATEYSNNRRLAYYDTADGWNKGASTPNVFTEDNGHLSDYINADGPISQYPGNNPFYSGPNTTRLMYASSRYRLGNQPSGTGLEYVFAYNHLLPFIRITLSGFPGITLDAQIVTTPTFSFTVNAIILRNSGDETFALDAWLVRNVPGSFALDATIHRLWGKTLTLDSWVAAPSQGAFTLDAIIFEAQPGDFTLDAIKLEAQPGDFTLDAHLAGTVNASFTLDSWVAGGTATGSFTLSAWLKLPATEIFSDDFSRTVAMGLGKSAGVNPARYSYWDSIWSDPAFSSVDGSTWVVEAGYKTGIFFGPPGPVEVEVTFDFWVPADLTDGDGDNWPYYVYEPGDFAGDFRDYVSVGGNGDGSTWFLGNPWEAVNWTPTASSWHRVKAYINNQTGGYFRAKAWKIGDPEPDWLISYVVTSRGASIYPSAQIYMDSPEDETGKFDNLYVYSWGGFTHWYNGATLDAEITNEITQADSFSLDAVIGRWRTIDAVILRTQREVFLLEAKIARNAITLDAEIAPGGALTLDAVIVGPVANSFTLDAWLFDGTTRERLFRVDAIVRRPWGGTFTLRAELFRPAEEGSFTIEALCLETMASSFTLDAEVFGGEQDSSFTLNADIQGGNERRGMFTLDAMRRQIGTGVIILEATIGGNGLFRVDAWLAGALTLDAFIVRAGLPGLFTLDARIANGFTLDALILRPQERGCWTDAFERVVSSGLGGNWTLDYAMSGAGIDYSPAVSEVDGHRVLFTAVQRSWDIEYTAPNDSYEGYSGFPAFDSGTLQFDFLTPQKYFGGAQYIVYTAQQIFWLISYSYTNEFNQIWRIFNGYNSPGFYLAHATWYTVKIQFGIGDDAPDRYKLWVQGDPEPGSWTNIGDGAPYPQDQEPRIQLNTWYEIATGTANTIGIDNFSMCPSDPTAFTLDAWIYDGTTQQRWMSLNAEIVLEPSSIFNLDAWLQGTSSQSFTLDAFIVGFTLSAWICLEDGSLYGGRFSLDAHILGNNYILWPDEQTGSDGSATATNTFYSPSASFNAGMVGSTIFIGGVAYTIVSVIDEHTVTISPEIASGQSGLSWSIQPDAVDPQGNPLPGWYKGNRKYRLNITVDGVDITGDVIWAETNFTQNAKTNPGTFQIALEGTSSADGGEVVLVGLDDFRTFGGIVLSVERMYRFSAEAEVPITVLRGADFNVLFDKLIVYNKDSADDPSGKYTNWKSFRKGTLDTTIINKVFSSYVDLPAGFNYTTYVTSVDVAAPEKPWTMPQAGSPLRQVMQSISQVTNAVWWIDPYLCLHYGSRTTVTAPHPITDGLGGISSQGISLSEDMSQLVTEAVLWGTLAYTTEGEVMAERRTSDDYAIRGPWQYGEFRADLHHEAFIERRIDSIIERYGQPIKKAKVVIFEPGYQAGQVADVRLTQHGVTAILAIQSLKLVFAVMKEPVGGFYYCVPRFELSVGLDPESPWDIYDYLPFPDDRGTPYQPRGNRGEEDCTDETCSDDMFDDFTRTVGNPGDPNDPGPGYAYWGASTPIGAQWSVLGPGASFAWVENGVGKWKHDWYEEPGMIGVGYGTGGDARIGTADFPSLWSTNFVLTGKFHIDSVPIGAHSGVWGGFYDWDGWWGAAVAGLRIKSGSYYNQAITIGMQQSGYQYLRFVGEDGILHEQAYSWSVGPWYRFKWKRSEDGARHQVKIWVDGYPEPGTWLIDVTDTPTALPLNFTLYLSGPSVQWVWDPPGANHIELWFDDYQFCPDDPCEDLEGELFGVVGQGWNTETRLVENDLFSTSARVTKGTLTVYGETGRLFHPEDDWEYADSTGMNFRVLVPGQDRVTVVYRAWVVNIGSQYSVPRQVDPSDGQVRAWYLPEPT